MDLSQRNSSAVSTVLRHATSWSVLVSSPKQKLFLKELCRAFIDLWLRRPRGHNGRVSQIDDLQSSRKLKQLRIGLTPNNVGYFKTLCSETRIFRLADEVYAQCRRVPVFFF